MTRPAPGLGFLLVFLMACDSYNNNRGKKDTGAIFFDYKIKGEERDSNITVYVQYRRGGPNGPALVLDDPASVKLDGEVLIADSARLTGSFYEIQKPSGSFAGKHVITFTTPDSKEYKEEFVYKPFKLRTKIPAVVNRGDFVFDFEGLDPDDHIRVSATDTSFPSRDINEIDTTSNGRLVIPGEKLKDLVNGPIILLLSKETERPLRNRTRGGGRLVVRYGLQREFELRDSLMKVK